MKIVKVYIEHPLMQLNNTFSYFYDGDKLVEKGMRVRVDFNGQKIIGFIDEVFDVEDLAKYCQKEGYNIKEVIEVIDNEPLLNDELYNLGLWMSKQTISPVISCFQAMLPPSLKPTSTAKSNAKEKWVIIRDDSLLELHNLSTKEMTLKQFKESVSEYRYNKYKSTGQLVVEDREKQAETAELKYVESDYQLSELQKNAIEEITNTDKNVVLLHGLTGSGKTEIYIQMTRKVVEQGKQVLILVPEIGLTPQMVSRFKSRFTSSIAIYHSGLSNTEKYQQYLLVKQGKVKIVVGTRSSVFMPFDNLGLIVLDEEHDGSYKQDSSPRYNTKDIAIKRSENHNCKVILGSATPTLESYARGLKDVYKLVTLNKRISNNLPKTHLIDMNYELRKGNFIISEPLAKAMSDRLKNHKQTILLLNRRGYTPVMKCGSCGEVVSCPHCDVALSYHKDENKLICHSCGYSISADITCPKCDSKKWRNYGLGTQRLAEEVESLFPESRVLRIDADSTRTKGSHAELLKKFEEHQYDVMIGTQMIAKGLDYPDVTLVGVFNADGPLNHSDYRSVEVTFDLIVQASGRSGRSKDPGEVFIQCYDVNHYGIKLAASGDYGKFFGQEMNYRKIGKYPPYSYMCAISFNSNELELSEDMAYKASEYFRNEGILRVLGPSKLLKKKDEYRHRIIMKFKDRDQMVDLIWKWYKEQKGQNRKVSIQIDMDPYVLE